MKMSHVNDIKEQKKKKKSVLVIEISKDCEIPRLDDYNQVAKSELSNGNIAVFFRRREIYSDICSSLG